MTSAPDCGLSPRVRGNPVRLCRVVQVGAVYPRRVRGNRGLELPTTSANRSIPACAGEPALSSPLGNPCRVYPRVCGGTPSGDYDSLAFP